MSVEQTKKVENITDNLSSTISNFSDKLKELMDKIMGPINKLLQDLGLKEKTEIDETIDQSKIDLKKLMEDINKNVDDKKELNEDEEKILKGILDKNEKLKNILDWIEEEFGKNTKARESAIFLSALKAETDGGEIEQSELDDIIENMEKNKNQIEKDKNLKTIIKNFPNIKNQKNGSDISTIIKAYNKVKDTKKDNITIDDVLANID